MPSDARTRRNIFLLAATSFGVSMAMAMNQALYFNFVSNVLRVRPHELGWVEAIRETPGFLSAFLTGATMHLPEPVVAGLAISLLGVGFAGYNWINGIPPLAVLSFVWSTGFHSWAPLSSSIGISLAPEGSRGELLGRIAGVAAVGALFGYGLVTILAFAIGANPQALYRPMYLAVGAIGLAAAAAVYRISHDIGSPLKPRLVWKRPYRLFYLLQGLEGCRKQIFITFAPFALVRVYGTSLRTMAVLLLVNYSLAFVLSPMVGKWIDRVGERRVLSINYATLILVFVGYASIHQPLGLYVLFCLDNVIFAMSMALTTYISKIAPESDLTPTLAMGVTMNHVAAVIVPLVGGYLWARLGYEICFLGGAAVVLLQLIAAQGVRPVPRKPVSPEALSVRSD